jgi:hypothetical protein
MESLSGKQAQELGRPIGEEENPLQAVSYRYDLSHTRQQYLETECVAILGHAAWVNRGAQRSTEKC